MSFVEPKIPIQHKVWTEGPVDGHGNATHYYADPVERLAMSVAPLDWRRTIPDEITPDYVARIEFGIEIVVEDPSLYKKWDLVLWWGLAFEVQSYPIDWSQGVPFRGFEDLLGGTVHARRVT